MNEEAGPHQTSGFAGTLISDLQPPELGEILSVIYKPPVYGVLL